MVDQADAVATFPVVDADSPMLVLAGDGTILGGDGVADPDRVRQAGQIGQRCDQPPGTPPGDPPALTVEHVFDGTAVRDEHQAAIWLRELAPVRVRHASLEPTHSRDGAPAEVSVPGGDRAPPCVCG